MIEIISTELKAVDPILLTEGYFIVRMDEKGWSGEYFQMKITYFKQFIKDGELKVELIGTKDYFITQDKYNMLYNNVPGELLEGKSPSEKDKIKKRYGLLTFVQNDFLDGTELTIGGLLPNQWIIKDNL